MRFQWETSYGMGWDRHKLLWDGNGPNKYVPCTTLGLSMGMSFLWDSHGKRPIGWDGNWTEKYVPRTTLHLTSLRRCSAGSIHETGFWLYKLPESCVSLMFSIAFLFPLLLFLSKLPLSIYKWTCHKNIFAQLSDNSRTVLTKATAFVIADQFSPGEEIREQ